MITGCATVAHQRGYQVFGLEYYGECWGTYKSVDYRADGAMQDNHNGACNYQVGFANQAISVFEFLL